MGMQLIVFGLLCGTVIQAFPSPYNLGNNENSHQVEFHPLISEDKQKTCNEKLDWYKNTTEKIKGYYDDYYLRFQKLKLSVDKINELEVEHEKFKEMVEESLEKYQEDNKKIVNISDTSLKATLCLKEIDWFNLMNQNLSGIAEHMRGDVSNVLETLGVPKETRDSLDAALARVVNYLFIIDLAKNYFKDMGYLLNELNKKTVKTVDGLKPEKDDKTDPGDVQYPDDAIEPDTVTATEKEEWSRTLSDLGDKSAIEEAKSKSEKRLEQIEEERKEETENAEREPIERELIYEVVPRV